MSAFHSLARRALPAALAIGAVAGLAAPAGAQQSGDGFVFSPPRVSITLRGAYSAAAGQSDVFDFTRKNLTVGARDFDGLSGGIDFGVRVSRRFHIVVSGERSDRSKPSEFRDWVDEGPTTSNDDDLPIAQTTRLRRTPLLASVRYSLADPGERISRFAFIPARYIPYVGAGIGGTWYKFEQTGRFVDFETGQIFHDSFTSDGWAPSAHAFAGVDYTLGNFWAISTEARYLRASTGMDQDFRGFNAIDLSGYSASIGLTLRF